MASNSGAPPLSPAAAGLLREGVSLVLSRWTALRLGVENEWGGRDSRLRAQELADSILRWFSDPKEALYIDDLENMLDDAMLLSFNAEIEDGSIQEVAEQLMIIHEECLQGKTDLISKLRESTPAPIAISQHKQNAGEEAESSDEEDSAMIVDEPKSKGISTSQVQKNAPDEEGWSVVAPRKGKSKR